MQLGAQTVLGGVFALGAIAIAACQGTDERAPAIDPGKPGIGGTTAGGQGGSGGTGGSSGSVATDAGAVDLQGTVVLLGSGFVTLEPFFGNATVVAEAPDGTFVSGTYAGTGTQFSLTGVLAVPGIWMGARPEQVGATFAGLWPIDPTAGDIEAPVVQRTAIDEIFSALLATGAAEDGRGHLIVELADASGAVPGLSVVAPSGALLAYAAGGTWSDNETETDSTGTFAILNADALEFPGSDQNFEIFEAGTSIGTVRLRVARDTVTIASIRLTN